MFFYFVIMKLEKRVIIMIIKDYVFTFSKDHKAVCEVEENTLVTENVDNILNELEEENENVRTR